MERKALSYLDYPRHHYHLDRRKIIVSHLKECERNQRDCSIPDVNVSSIHKALLNVLKELVYDGLECGEVLRVGGAMVAQHLGAEDSGELAQGLQVVEVNHQRAERVVQNLTEALEKRRESLG